MILEMARHFIPILKPAEVSGMKTNKIIAYSKWGEKTQTPVTARIKWLADGTIEPQMYWMPDCSCFQVKHIYECTALAFLKEKGVKTRNHLISGSPASQLLSYLANQDMFDSVHTLSNKNGIMMTLYVDDIIFSSPNRISANFIEIVENIISSQGYRLSKRKAKSHTKYYPKRVTGVIINKQGDISISNSIRKKTIDKCRQLKANPDDEQSRRELRGLVETARQVIPNAYPSIHKLAYDPNYKLSHMKQKPTPSIIKK